MKYEFSTEKKYELALAALTCEFSHIEEGMWTDIIALKPKNTLGLDGFCETVYLTDTKKLKNPSIIRSMLMTLEKNIANEESLNQLTRTKVGNQLIQDYQGAKKEGGESFQNAFKAFKTQLLSMFTLKAQKDLFESFTENLKELNNAGLLDRPFINEVAKDLFPESNWKLSVRQEVKRAANTQIKNTELDI